MEQVIDTDIAIVGAGGCGLTAAITAASRGARVLILEQDALPGGSTSMSAGLFVAAGSWFQRENSETGTPQELAEDILKMNGRQSDAMLTQALCQISGPLMDWLAAHDVPMEHLPDYKYPGMSRSWLHAPPQRHGAVVIQALARRAKDESAINLRTLTAVTGLIFSEGSVNGLWATTADGKRLNVKARAVILAASGFGANLTMVSQHIPEMSGAAYFGSPHATGGAISWGREIGAALDHMSAYQPHSSIAYPEMLLVTTYLINHGAIQVNQAGQRFGDETDTYAGHAIAVQRQPNRTVIEIFDEHIRLETLKNYPRFKECLDAGIVQSAKSLDELATIFDLERSNLSATVEQSNTLPPGARDEFGRVGSGRPLTPPFYGIRVTSALVQTLGGLRVNPRAQVLRPNGSPIPGLYAGGGTAAGLAGDRPEGYMAGTGLLAAFGLGWIAGREASFG